MPILVHFISLIPKCRCSLLPSPVWPLPIYLDSWAYHSRFLYTIAPYSIGPCFCHQSHPQLGVVFALLCLFILSRVISPLICSSILVSYQSLKGVLSFCLFIPLMGFSRQRIWSGLLFRFAVDYIFSELSTFCQKIYI